MKVFISHSWKNKTQALQIADDLKAAGMEISMDAKDLLLIQYIFKNPHTMKKLLIVFTLVFLFNFNSSWSQNWINLGPMSTINSGIGVGVIKQIRLITINGESKLYASSPDGGLWLCDNINSDTWKPLSDYAESLEVVSFSVSKSNFNKIYMVTANNEIYKSTDLGTNWLRLNWGKANGKISIIEISASNDELVFIGTNTGLFISEDGGLTWLQRRTNSEITDIVIDPTDDNYLYFGGRREGVFRSKDRGVSWNRLLLWERNARVCTNGEDESENNRLERADMIKIALAAYNSDGTAQNKDSKTLAVKMGTSVYVTNRNNVLEEKLSCWGSTKNSNQNEWNNVIAINPKNPEEIIVGATTLRISTDGGGSWGEGFKSGHEDSHSIQYINNSTFFVANDGGVYKVSMDGTSQTAVKFQKSLCVSQLLRFGINGNKAVGNSNHNGIIGTTSLSDGVWNRAVGRDCGFLNNNMEENSVYGDNLKLDRFFVFYPNESLLLRLIYPRTNNSSTDDCEGNMLPIGNFQPYRDGYSPKYPQGSLITLDRFSGLNRRRYIFVCNQNSATEYSLKYTIEGAKEPSGTNRENSGDMMSWSEDLTSSVPIVSLATNQLSSRIYAITNTGVLHSKVLNYNYGSTAWDTPQNNMGNLGFLAGGILHMGVSFRNDNKIYAISQNSLFISTNRGGSWVQRLRNAQIPVDSYFAIKVYEINNRTILYMATSQGVYKTSNDGLTWNKLPNLPNVKVSQIHITDGYLYAVTYGRGLWRVPIAEVD